MRPLITGTSDEDPELPFFGSRIGKKTIGADRALIIFDYCDEWIIVFQEGNVADYCPEWINQPDSGSATK